MSDTSPDITDDGALTEALENMRLLHEAARTLKYTFNRIDQMKADDELTTEQVRWLKTGEVP